MKIFKMSKNDTKYEFLYSGVMKYKPNKSSASGYGSDVWFYLCRYQNDDCLLIFSDTSGYGTIWECTKLDEIEAQNLKFGDLDLWNETYYKAKKHSNILGLHLENIDEVMDILPECSRCYEFSDIHYYGQY